MGNKKEQDKPVKPVSVEDLSKYNKFYKFPCPVVRDHVFHGVTEEGDTQTIVCLQCGKKYEFHKIDERSKVERSLWELFEQNKDKVDLSPPPKKRPKKKWKWSQKYLFQREKRDVKPPLNKRLKKKWRWNPKYLVRYILKLFFRGG